jgi:hypothetical protein
MATMVFDQLASYYDEHGDAKKSHELFDRNLELMLALPHEEGDAEYDEDLCIAYAGAARGRYQVGDLDGAKKAILESIERGRALTTRDPSNLHWLKLYAQNLDFRGHIAYAADDLDAAFEAFTQGLEIARRLPVMVPGSPDLQRDLAASELNLAMLYLQVDKLEEANEHYYACFELFEELRAKHPDNRSYESEMGLLYRHLTQLELMKGNHERALEHAHGAMRIAQHQFDTRPEMSTAIALSGAYVGLADVEDHNSNLARARELLEPYAERRNEDLDLQMAFDAINEASQ